MLNNKEPTKDVSKDDIKNKIPQITSSLNRVIKISKNISFGKKISLLLQVQTESKVKSYAQSCKKLG